MPRVVVVAVVMVVMAVLFEKLNCEIGRAKLKNPMGRHLSPVGRLACENARD